MLSFCKNLFIYFFLIVATNALQADEINSFNASCILRFGDQIVLVRDLWSKRYALPGGVSRLGEKTSDTAQRVTLEQTGIKALAGRILGQTSSGFYFHECEGRVEVLSSNVINHPKLAWPKLAWPKLAWNEISEVVLKNPTNIHENLWRFPSHRNLILELVSKTKSLEPSLLVAVQPKPSWLETHELNAIKYIKSFKSKFTDTFFLAFSFLGDQPFLMAIIPFIWLVIHQKNGISLFFLFMFSALIHGNLKQLFAFARPFHFYPELKAAAATGFGFPSGHATSATVLWGFLGLFLVKRIGVEGFWKKRTWLITFIIIFFASLSRVYLGVHFFHDILGGWGLGALVLSVYGFYTHRNKDDIPLSIWWTLSLIIVLVSLTIRPHPDTVAYASVLLGMWFSFLVNPLDKRVWNPKISKRLCQFAITVAGLFFIELAFKSLTPKEGLFSMLLIHQVLRYACLGFWFGLLPIKRT